MMVWGHMLRSRGRLVPPDGMDEDRPSAREVAEWWKAEGAAGLHVTDEDGARGGHADWTCVGAALRTGLPIRFGGGVRTMVQVQQLLDLGVHEILVGTQAVLHPAWGREVAALWPDRVVLSLDVRRGAVMVEGRQRRADASPVDVARTVAGTGLAGIVYTPLADHVPAPPDLDLVRALAGVAPVTVAGGDPGAVEAAGATGRLVGGRGT